MKTSERHSSLLSAVRPALRRAAAMLCLLVVFAACEHKPLCWHHPHNGMLKVDFAWWANPEGEEIVKSMALYVYPKDGSKHDPIHFVGSAGGVIMLPVGDYDFLCINSDTETILYKDTEAHNTFKIHTPDAHPLSGMEVRSIEDFSPDDYENIKRAQGTYDERVCEEAEIAYGHMVENFHVHGEPGVMQVVTLYPQALTVDVHVIIEDVVCLDMTEKVSGTLSGLSGMVQVGTARRVGNHHIVPFSLIQTEERTLEGYFTCFGHCPDDVRKAHKLAIYAVTEDDDHRFFEFDVTSQVEEAPNQRIITIVIKGLDICGMEDMSVVVDPWIGIPPIVVPMG